MGSQPFSLGSPSAARGAGAGAPRRPGPLGSCFAGPPLQGPVSGAPGAEQGA